MEAWRVLVGIAVSWFLPTDWPVYTALGLVHTPPPPAVQAWYDHTAYWLTYLKRRWKPVCRVIPLSRDKDELPPAESLEAIAERTGVPLWVLERMNGEDPEITLESRLKLPAYPGWPSYQYCNTPTQFVRY